MSRIIAAFLIFTMVSGSAIAGSFTTQISSVQVKGGSNTVAANVIQVNLVSPNWVHPLILSSDPSKSQLLSTLLTAKTTGATVTINTLDNDPNYPTIIEIQF